jgi:anti-sigma B factor antagonist
MERQPFHISSEREEDRYSLALLGELDLASAPAFEARVRDLCEHGASEMVLDLSRLQFIDSAGLNAILRSREVCSRYGCLLVMTPVQSSVGRVFERTRLVDRLPFRRPVRSGTRVHS